MAQVEIIAANLKNNDNNISVKNVKKRVGAYARVSSDSEEQLTSYSSQIKYYTEKIKSNPDWEFVGIYADEGISGTQVKNRTEFMRMIDDALNGKIDIILAKSISRFARNTIDTLKYCRELRDKKVDVYFEKENIHTLELDSEMFLTLYSAFAQAESESISQNVKLGLKAKMKRGEACGKCECYGYTWNKDTKELEINEEQAEVVRKVFNWYADGIGCKKIAVKLNNLGILTYTGRKWTQATIKEMIRQEKYVGDLVGQKFYTPNPMTHKKVRNYGEKPKYYVKDHHEPIISRELWDKTRVILNKRHEETNYGGRKTNNRFTKTYAFSSKICCAFCGRNYVRRMSSKRSDGTYCIYWSCYSRVDNPNNCDAVVLKDEKLKETFVELYNSIIKNKHKTKELLLNAVKEVVSSNENKSKLEKLQEEQVILTNRLSKLIDLKLDGLENQEIYELKEKEITDRLSIIKAKINELQNLIQENKDLSKKIKMIEEQFEEPITLKEFDRNVFDNMVDKIVVGDYDENGNKLTRVVRFILKMGNEYSFTLSDDSRKSRKKVDNNNVSLVEENVV